MRTATTTVPLAANGVWTSLTLETGLADKIVGMVFTDQDGTIFIEQAADLAADGTSNWDISTSYPITAGDGKGFEEDILGPYARVRYVNGGVDQTAFRLHVRMTSAGPR